MKNNVSKIKIIKAKKGWELIDWRELYEYKDLFYFLVFLRRRTHHRRLPQRDALGCGNTDV